MKTQYILIIAISGVIVLSFLLSGNNVFAQTTQSDFQNMTLEKIDTSDIYQISHTPTNGILDFDVLDWSQNGKFLVFKYHDYKKNSVNHIGLMDLTAKKIHVINTTLLSNKTQFLFYDAKFSNSDDNSMYFLLNGDIYHYTINSDTSSRITTHSGIYIFDVLKDGNLSYLQQTTSSDSLNSTDQSETVLWIADSNGIKIKEIYATSDDIIDFTISPDEKKIALVTYHSNGSSLPSSQLLKIVNLGTNQTVQLNDIDPYVDKVRWSPNSQLLVYHIHSGWSAPGGTLKIRDPITGYDKILYSATNNLRGFTISPDGKSIIFGLDSSQLYRMDLLRPIPEFPLVSIVFLASISSVIVFHRLRLRK